MNPKKVIKWVIITISSIAVLWLIAFSAFFLTLNYSRPSDKNYFYPSPDKQYTAVLSENNLNYYVHIKPETTEKDLTDLINGKEVKKEYFFSRNAYGKNGRFIIEWEKSANNLWIWSSDIGLYVIMEKDGSWEEYLYSKIKNQIDSSNIPDEIRKYAEL
ncbi:MAG: hypothetical protein J6Y60_09505 [Treponema sp.]|nr:hypothetical protein [Treponema sp.]